MTDFQKIVLIYFIIQVLISYICFLIRNTVIFANQANMLSGLFFLLAALCPIILAIVGTNQFIKSHKIYKKEKPPVEINNTHTIKINLNDVDKELDNLKEEIKKIIEEENKKDDSNEDSK